MIHVMHQFSDFVLGPGYQLCRILPFFHRLNGAREFIYRLKHSLRYDRIEEGTYYNKKQRNDPHIRRQGGIKGRLGLPLDARYVRSQETSGSIEGEACKDNNRSKHGYIGHSEFHPQLLS